MPFERARTQLLLGRLIRRERSDATAALRDALAIFEQLGTPLWADRARAELAGAGRRARRPAQDGLTPPEQRVAELAASGLTNRDVAATLFLSARRPLRPPSRVSTANWASDRGLNSGDT
jgi:ATP/maltotriose-dependent transcriptional regulator MalT